MTTAPLTLWYDMETIRESLADVEDSLRFDLGKRMPLHDSFKGCLLGIAVGDAYGRPYEGASRSTIEQLALCEHYKTGPGERFGVYTDDTHMALCVAESLIRSNGLDVEDLAAVFLGNYKQFPRNGFGKNTKLMLTTACSSAELLGYPTKSEHSNGAAMRAAPIGLFFHYDLDRLKRAAIEQAKVTHAGDEAIGGSVAVAYAVGNAIRAHEKNDDYDRVAFLDDISRSVDDVCKPLAKNISHMSEFIGEPNSFFPLKALGGYRMFHGPSTYVIESVPLSLLFSVQGHNFFECISKAVAAGGDTDTQASIAGAIAGARYGFWNIPQRLRSELEQGRGAIYILDLADKLHEALNI